MTSGDHGGCWGSTLLGVYKADTLVALQSLRPSANTFTIFITKLSSSSRPSGKLYLLEDVQQKDKFTFHSSIATRVTTSCHKRANKTTTEDKGEIPTIIHSWWVSYQVKNRNKPASRQGVPYFSKLSTGVRTGNSIKLKIVRTPLRRQTHSSNIRTRVQCMFKNADLFSEYLCKVNVSLGMHQNRALLIPSQKALKKQNPKEVL